MKPTRCSFKEFLHSHNHSHLELLMITQIGEQVEFGQIKEVGEKFEKLKLYYEKGNSQNQEYKVLNLKYKNQIVCIKK